MPYSESFSRGGVGTISSFGAPHQAGRPSLGGSADQKNYVNSCSGNHVIKV